MVGEVERLLQDKEVQYVDKGKDFLVHCFNPEHEDNNPSLRIDRDTGLFHCLGCGYKGDLFVRFNRYRNIFNSKVLKALELIKELREASWAGYDLPTDAFLVSEMFRGIPAHTLSKFGAFKTAMLGMSGRLVFPIRDVRGVIVGFQGRLLNSLANPKYLMYPKKVSLPWYPAANLITMTNNSIVVTEGILDAMYLQGKGITNAITMFGTKSVNQDNILELLTPFMLAGLQKVYLLLDGDIAGRSAAKHLEGLIKLKTDLIVEVLQIEEGQDPATLSDDQINNIKNLLHKY